MKLFGNSKSGRVASRKDASATRHSVPKQNIDETQKLQPPELSADAAQTPRPVTPKRPADETRPIPRDSEQYQPEPEEENEGNPVVAFWRGLPGVVKGLIMLVAALLLLLIVLVIVYKTVVKPPDISSGNQSVSAGMQNSTDDKDTFHMPQKEIVTVYEEVDEDGNIIEVEVTVEVPVSHKEGYYNILVAGTDYDGTHTDTIMIARLDVNNHSVALLSVPRDTLIDANYPVPKINSAYSAGGMGESGMRALRTQLARLLGFEVDGYVLIDFDAFAEMIELVGDEENGEKGIWFNVPTRMYYSDTTQDLYIDLYAGYQHLNADECEDVVRYRGYDTADIGRVAVQQDFIRALANQCLQIGNITKIQELAEIYIDYVTTDLTIGNMVYFAQELLECNFDEMQTFALEGEGVYIDNLSYYEIYTNKNLSVINEHFNPYDTQITAAHVVIPSASWYQSSVPSEPDEPETPDEPDAPDTPDPTDPGTTDPGTTDPSTTDPGTTDPGTTDPGTIDPGTTEPDETDPGTAEPGGDTSPDAEPPEEPDTSGSESGEAATGIISPSDLEGYGG